ncbi:hypothetical protein J6S88_06720 [bacterium]|nr:hypothetical protein [bacterium]
MGTDIDTERYINLYNSLSPAERTSYAIAPPESIIGKSPDEIKRILLRLELCANKTRIEGSLAERKEELALQAQKSERRWTEARERYYASLMAIPINKLDKDYNQRKKEADDNWFELTLAAEAYVGDNKRYNMSFWC